MIIAATQQTGMKWAEIARLLPGRTDNAVKNRWNSTLRRRLAQDGAIAQAAIASMPEEEQASFLQQLALSQMQGFVVQDPRKSEEPPLPSGGPESA
jgi:hypothetical protein